MKTVETVLARAVGLLLPGASRRIRTAGVRFAVKTCAALGLLLGVFQGILLAASASPESVIGSWGPRFPLPLIAIHATAFPNGKVLLFSARSNSSLSSTKSSSSIGSDAWVWDPGTGDLTDVSLTYSYDMMCGGNTLLPDGKVLVIGGRINAQKTVMFNSATETWIPGPTMPLARYYPTAIEVPDGRVFIFGGRNDTAESYDPKTNKLTLLPAKVNRKLALYPRMHVMPDGRLFDAGPEQQTSVFDLGTNTWSGMGQMTYGTRFNGSTVLLPGLNRVLSIGGDKGAGATNTAEIIDVSQDTPQWRQTASMHIAREHLNVVLLPDGTVLVVGGRGADTLTKSAELFDPVTEGWTRMAAQVALRGYHSTAILLPDGRVLSAGDGDENRLTGEIYSPPYLFKGGRPTIASVNSSSLGYGQAFSISTPDAGSIGRVALLKPGVASHGVNVDQRYVDLQFSANSGQVFASSPAGPNLAPPGWYMLFIVDSRGVPSVASWVQVVDGKTDGPTCAPAAPTVTAMPAQGPTVQAGTTVAYTISVKNNDSAPCTPSSFALQATAPIGWQSIFTAPSLTVAPGAIGTTTLNVTSLPSPPGPYTTVATAMKTGTPSDAGSASMTYTVAPPPVGSNSAFRDDFNRTTLTSNWQVIEGVMTIQNNELRNGAAVGQHRAVVPALTGANETVTASFASTAVGSKGFRLFGLILRYKNPTNYYMLYRQAGSSGLLQIAKVVNGVPTILGSTNIQNPQRDVLFSMTAKATGSTLTITQGTHTVSVTDTTFTSGSVGILMGNTKDAFSHRADDFNATVQ